MADQMIFKRYEIKYLLHQNQYQQIRKIMEKFMETDNFGHSTIHSLYLDTPDFLLARRSLEKPFYKEKLRLRSYGDTTDTSTVFVEIKKKYDSVVYKRRIAMTEIEARQYILSHKAVNDSQISREISYFMTHYENLSPKVLISYERDAFFAAADNNLRITFDSSIRWRETDLSLTAGDQGQELLSDGQVLMEIKLPEAAPLWLAHMLSRLEVFPRGFSKYGQCYQKELVEKYFDGVMVIA